MKKPLKLAIWLFLSYPAILRAAELKPDTLKAWDEYIQTATSRMNERLHAGKFLWIDDAPDRARRVRQGEALVSPVAEHMPKNVPHGLIHDWIGAVFIPSVHLSDVFDVVRDYGRYKDFYRPAVMDSKQVSQSGDREFRFSMVLLNQSLFMKNALESDYKASYVRVDDRRWYSIAYTTRVQEIDDYGQPGEHRLPMNQGSGYIWRLYSLARYEERDGGVYVELEAIALSRDIPISVRWMVEPIVRRISRNSLETSLHQTAAHVPRPALQVAQVTNSPTMERR